VEYDAMIVARDMQAKKVSRPFGAGVSRIKETIAKVSICKDIAFFRPSRFIRTIANNIPGNSARLGCRKK